MDFQWPSTDDWKRIEGASPFERLQVSIGEFAARLRVPQEWPSSPFDCFAVMAKQNEIMTWENHLQKRLFDVRASYIMMIYYYEMGIPDDKWYMSPGRNGQSVEYFPNFQDTHFQLKTQFDYFADVFYYKIFTAWDTIGQLLNIMFEFKMKMEDVTFHKVVAKLKDNNQGLYEDLGQIECDSAFCQARRLRHDTAHNYLPTFLGPSVKRSSNKVSETIELKVRDYIPSTEIKNNAVAVLHVFVKTLEAIRTR